MGIRTARPDIISGLIILLGIASFTNADAQTLPDWFEREYEAMQDDPLYEFTMDFDDSGYQGQVRVNMTAPRGERFTVLSPSAKDRPKGFDKNINSVEASFRRENLWCLSILDEKPRALKPISETVEVIIYSTHFKSSKQEGFRIDFTVSKSNSQLIRIQKWAPKPFKPAWFMKLTSFDMITDCAQSPDGRAYISSTTLNMRGSAFGKQFDKKIYQSISSLSPVEIK